MSFVFCSFEPGQDYPDNLSVGNLVTALATNEHVPLDVFDKVGIKLSRLYGTGDETTIGLFPIDRFIS